MSLATNLAQIPNITVNRIPRATATGFANSAIFDNGTNIGVNTSAPIFNDIVMPYAKTATSTVASFFIRSNEAAASAPFGLRFQIVGGAALVNRYAALQTTDYNSADGGSIILQPGGGNVGIGVTTPNYTFQVYTSSVFGNAEDGNISVRAVASGSTPTSPTTVGGIVFGDAAIVNSYLGRLAVIQDNPSSSTTSHMRFYTNNGGGNTSTLERARITGRGDFGLGTTTPTAIGNYRSFTINGVEGSLIDLNFNGAANGRIFSASSVAVGIESLSTTLPLEFKTQNGSGTTTRMSIMPNGSIGIGTANPSKILEVYANDSSTTTTAGLKITNFSTTNNSRAGIVFQNYDNNAAAIWSNRTGSVSAELIFGTNQGTGGITEGNIIERMRITTSGKLCVGSTDGIGQITNYVTGSTITSGSVTFDSQAKGYEVYNSLSAVTDNLIGYWFSTGPHKTGIASGRTNASAGWEVDLRFFVHGPDTNNLNNTYERMRLYGGGNLTINGSLTQNGSLSDFNLKENLVKIDQPLQKLSQLGGYKFTWKEGSPARQHFSNIIDDAGLIAQEVEAILPEVVRTNVDGTKALNYNGVVGLLVEAVKEQQQEINQLKSQLGGK